LEFDLHTTVNRNLDDELRDPRWTSGMADYYRRLLEDGFQPNKEQQDIINEVKTAFDAYRQMEYGDKEFANVPRLFFITGEGGSGKTFLFNVNIRQIFYCKIFFYRKLLKL
jgi:predicted ATPase